jgi:protein SCO1
MKKKTTFALALFLCALQLVWSDDNPARAPDPFSNYTAYRVDALRQHFPNVPLRTQDNQSVRFYDDVIKGKVVVIQFMYADCEKYCPMITPNLVRVQKELKQRGATQVSMISITVDPEHDTPQVLKAYAKQYGAAPGWKFLTGTKADVDLIRRQLGVYDPDQQKIAHMNVLTIGKEPTGQWLAMEALGKPGNIVDTVLRLDPAARRH